MISNDGIIIRIAVADVNIMSRYATGVRVMRLSENDRLVAFATAEHAPEETEAVEADPADLSDEAEEVDMTAEEMADEFSPEATVSEDDQNL